MLSFFSKKRLQWALAIFAFLIMAVVVLDLLFPMDLKTRTHSQIVVAEDGTPLRVFPDAVGSWRYPVTLSEVSPLYLEALIGFEDRWFYRHPGVNPLSLMRAFGQWIKEGRIISGGSTLTMQVSRLRRPVPRTMWGKVLQMAGALQLEFHFTKDEILSYYLNHAPFGGAFEGVQAASFAYFDHSAKELTHAQAALLAVLPQSPTRFRPDRNPGVAEKARNKCLDRLSSFKVWEEETVKRAKEEPVIAWKPQMPMHAPLLSRRLHSPYGKARLATTIDAPLQETLEELARDDASRLPQGASLAILVMENGGRSAGAVKAYVGSADFTNLERFAHVDMVTALRSPGSTVKPFVYGMALDEGLICSESLLMDVPIRFGDYEPVNFHRRFSGPVSAASALKQSLNMPAVQLLDHLGPRLFYARMANSGFRMSLPDGAIPNLSMALGGFATTLEELVTAFSSLGRGGVTIRPRYRPDDEVREETLLSSGAAWIVHQMLLPGYHMKLKTSGPQVAIKTGTSYGFRDAWALGVTRDYTVGVWVGRPDGTPIPGHYGGLTAVPLLTQVFRFLPENSGNIPRPESVTEADIAWPSGFIIGPEEKPDARRHAFLLNQTAPPSLSATRDDQGSSAKEVTLRITEDGRYRVPPGCGVSYPTVRKKITLWPVELDPFLDRADRRQSRIPPLLPGCASGDDLRLDEPVSISGLSNEEVLMRRDASQGYPCITLSAQGGQGPWYWFVDGMQRGKGPMFQYCPDEQGQHQILLVGQSGAMDHRELSVK